MSTAIFAPDSLDAVDRLVAADIVVAVTACETPEDVRRAMAGVCDATGRSSADLRCVLVFPDTTSVNDLLADHPPDPALQLVPCRLPAVGRLPFAAGDERDLFLPLSAIADRVGARACGLIGGRPESVTPNAIRGLMTPVLDHNIDLVLPSYPRHTLDGLINNGIVYPLTRALYGKRVDGQLGLDFGFSVGLLSALAHRPAVRGSRPPIWLLTEATERGLRVGQAHMEDWLPPVEHATDVSTALSDVVGSLFNDVEHHASIWQRTRGSQPVPTFGEDAAVPDEHRDVDVRTMIESFRIGIRNLPEVWGQLLPPATLLELNRMTRLAPDAFRMPDKVWVRVVFDFAVGYRLRLIGRDHLLRALTPVYLAWVASFVLEVGNAGRAAARERLERLCVAYEKEKPYLLARWRWPDRFNP